MLFLNSRKEINLLPPDRRRFLFRRYLERVTLHFLGTVIAGLCIMTVGGGLTIVILRGVAASTSDQVQAELMQHVTEFKRIREEVARSNKLYQTMGKLHSERTVWSSLLPSFFEALPPGTVIDILAAENSSQKITVGGKAAARSTLVVLEERLQALPWVQSVDSPTSNLLVRDNPVFSLILKLRKASQ